MAGRSYSGESFCDFAARIELEKARELKLKTVTPKALKAGETGPTNEKFS